MTRRLAGVLARAVGVGGACSASGGSSSPPPAPPAAVAAPAPVAEETTATTERSPLVSSLPRPAPEALPEEFDDADGLDESIVEPDEPTVAAAPPEDDLGEPNDAGDQATPEEELVEPPAQAEESAMDPAEDLVSAAVTPTGDEPTDYPERDLQRAADPSTPPSALAELVGYETDAEVAVRRAVAANPATPPTVLAGLLSDGDPGVRWLAAANPSNWPQARNLPEVRRPPGELEPLPEEPEEVEPEPVEPDPRRDAAANPGPWHAVLATLTADLPARQWAAANPRTPAGALLALAWDPEPDVAVWVASNPNAPPDALAHIVASTVDPMACRAVAENRSTPPSLLAALADQAAVGRFLRRNEVFGCAAPGALIGVARNPVAPAATLSDLAGDQDPTVRSLVAGNPSTPTSALTDLATDDDFLVRRAVAANPATPPEVLADLAADDDPGVAWEAASNPSAPDEVIAELVPEDEAPQEEAEAVQEAPAP
ncbi:MAG: hypothetical protein F4236_04335 [Acidimicrobiia bacterium]|nr:hypothetical protein [Acidimicrobiia bacterium]